jgi:pimeloyl-ACP methyl ester carboxylesterase/DNA-binding winged helix-turn-helix (wHTH) protein
VRDHCPVRWRFGRCELDLDRVELRRDGEPAPLEPQAYDVLVHLVRHRDRVVPKTELLDEVWGTRFVSESTLSSRIKSVRQAVGDNGRDQRVIRTVHGRGYHFVAEVAGDEAAGPAGVDGTHLDLDISFVEGRGGVSLAVGATGDGPTLVKVATWMTQVDRDTDASPIWGHWVRCLSRRHRYVRYDPRGSGLSDRDLRGIPLDDLDLWVEDLEAVVAGTGSDRVALLGVSQGGPVAVAFAVRHPDVVSHLVLFGTYARGMARRDDAHQARQAGLHVDLARVGWGPGSGLFREVFARQFVPRARPEEIEWFTDQLRLTTDATNAPLLEGAFHDLDVSDLARRVRVPTLVMHATGDEAVPFEEGRRLAGLVPGARFVPLDSPNHILLESDAAFSQFVEQIDRFTALEGD